MTASSSPLSSSFDSRVTRHSTACRTFSKYLGGAGWGKIYAHEHRRDASCDRTIRRRQDYISSKRLQRFSLQHTRLCCCATAVHTSKAAAVTKTTFSLSPPPNPRRATTSTIAHREEKKTRLTSTPSALVYSFKGICSDQNNDKNIVPSIIYEQSPCRATPRTNHCSTDSYNLPTARDSSGGRCCLS